MRFINQDLAYNFSKEGMNANLVEVYTRSSFLILIKWDFLGLILLHELLRELN